MSELNKALIKFQSELKPVSKDMKNAYFNSKYATLAAVIEEVLPILTKNDLCFTQAFNFNNGTTFLETKVMHTSGEFIASTIPMQPMNDVQKMGSQITYLKRYSLMAILGVSSSDEDDDGNMAVKKPENKPNPNYKAKYETLEKLKTELTTKTKGMATDQKQQFLKDNLKVNSFKDVEKMSNDELVNLYNKLSGTLLK